MAETLRELVVALSLDSSNFSRNMRTINQQIKEAESTFRLAGAGVENYEKTIAGTEAKLSMLGNKLTQQQRAVEQYSRALVAANDKIRENYNRHQDYSQRLEQAKARQEDLRFEVETATVAYEHYRDTLGETDSATIAAKQNLEWYQEEYAEATAEVTKLEGQVKALQKTMQNSADAVSKATTDLNNAKAAVKDTEAEIRRMTEQLYRMQSAWTKAGETLTAISKKCETISKAMTKAGKTLTKSITTPIVTLGTAAVKASIDYEYAFADVRKTVDATEEEYEKLSQSVKQMSTEVAASAEDIAEVMSIAGQLGIENEHLAEFARTMIDLGNSTNMVSSDAASQAARFANIMGMSQDKFQNLGSTLVDLGNNYATTESEIMEMSLRLAGAGKQVGLSEAQIMGFAAALSSVGIQAQMGGSAFSKALIKMEVASATGGEALEDFAKVSGMTASQFKDLWERDAASAFQAFIVGLSKMDEQGVSAIKTLDDIGISEIRLRDTLLRATNATELFSKTQETANKAWSQNTALTNEANKRYVTTKSRLTNLKNTALMFARQMAYEEVTGGASTAALTPKDVVGMVTKYAQAENVDLSALKPSQIEAMVTKFAEATGCDKSALLKEFTAYITEYKEAAGVKKPTLNVQVGLAGYDLLAYRKWLKNNKVEVEGIVRLSEAYEDPSSVLGEAGVKYWKDGQEIPVSAVASDMLKPEDVAVLDKDGTMHILITTEVTGAPEAIAEMRAQVPEVDQLGMTKIGTALTGIMPTSLLGYIDAAEKRIENAKNSLNQWWNFIYGGNEGIMRTLDQSMQNDFSSGRVAELSAYVSEVVSAIKQGNEVSQADVDNLNKILQFVQDLDTAGVGENVTAGIAEGMTAAGWDSSAETVAANLEAAIKSALVINSPSERLKPAGEYAAAGIGEGMSRYDFSSNADALAGAIESAVKAALRDDLLTSIGTSAAEGLAGSLSAFDMSSAGSSISTSVRNAVSSSLTAGTLRSIGFNAMAGLRAGIIAGRSGVVSAMQSAARAAVNAAKQELKIASPSRVFRDEVGSMTMKGFGEGILKESRIQARIIRNAARFLTGEAKDGAVALGSTDNRKTYNNTSSVNLSGNNFYVRDEQDIRALAIEIATLTRRQQRGRGLRMA